MKKILLYAFVMCVSVAYSQDDTVHNEIKETIHLFFKGLHNGDTISLKASMHDEIKLQTAFTNKEGVNVLRTDNKSNILKAVASKKPEDIWFEKLLSYKISVDGPLASVWTPYEFYVNEKFSHCGANSFQLFKDGDNWKIIYLVDTRKRNGCE